MFVIRIKSVVLIEAVKKNVLKLFFNVKFISNKRYKYANIQITAL